jgi:1-acyl-sn-glycerol-3-phosphate acyltransferase
MNESFQKPVSEIWRPDLIRLPELTRTRRAFRVFSHGLLKLIAKICLDVSSEGMGNLPQKGPLLVVINHLGDADAPAIISVLPFPPDAMGKIELFDFPILGKLMDWYGVIWLHRGRADRRALRAALDGFAEGRVIIIAPEGRYSVTGALEEGSDGAAFLAYKSGVPILPIAIIGTENENVHGQMKKFRRARVHVKVGKTFKLAEQAKGDALSESKGRREAVTEGTRQIMQALASLLPEKYRGAYSRS